MFDNVFTDKQWKTARDNAGLKGGLTEKVSMGDEFKRFQQNKTVATAKVLQQKIALYEKQLKEKHSKEKYYAKLLRVVQDQKAAIEEGIQAVENPVVENKNPVDATGKVMSDKDMDQLADEVAEREKEHLRGYENTNNDPNAPVYPGEGRRVYLKLTTEFPTIEGKVKAEGVVLTELLKRCQDLEKNPNLQAKPEVAIGIAQKIVATLNKIETKSTDLHSDFVTEVRVVHKESANETGAIKELDGMVTRLNDEIGKIVDTGRACRLAVKNAMQPFASNPQAQEILKLLHI